jgi:hypothetical protein
MLGVTTQDFADPHNKKLRLYSTLPAIYRVIAPHSVPPRTSLIVAVSACSAHNVAVPPVHLKYHASFPS